MFDLTEAFSIQGCWATKALAVGRSQVSLFADESWRSEGCGGRGMVMEPDRRSVSPRREERRRDMDSPNRVLEKRAQIGHRRL